MKTVYIGIGSNKGNRINNIKKSIKLMEENNIKIQKLSSFYETSPVGKTDQSWFINCVIKGKTDSTALELLNTLQKIERKLHRKRKEKWGPRTIDLDLLLYNSDVIKTRDLTIPHPLMHSRKFVLKPLLEISPKLRHPEYKKSFSSMFKKISSDEIVEKICRN